MDLVEGNDLEPIIFDNKKINSSIFIFSIYCNIIHTLKKEMSDVNATADLFYTMKINNDEISNYKITFKQ